MSEKIEIEKARKRGWNISEEDKRLAKKDGRGAGRNNPCIDENGQLVKKCPKCEMTLPRNHKYYAPAKPGAGGAKDGMYPQCRECKRSTRRVLSQKRLNTKEGEASQIHATKKYREKTLSKIMESDLNRYIADRVNGELEINHKYGRIDILSSDYIIEVKKEIQWKSAVGQLLLYSLDYEEHCKVVIIYGKRKLEKLNEMQMSCEKLGIKLKYIEFQSDELNDANKTIVKSILNDF